VKVVHKFDPTTGVRSIQMCEVNKKKYIRNENKCLCSAPMYRSIVSTTNNAIYLNDSTCWCDYMGVFSDRIDLFMWVKARNCDEWNGNREWKW